MRCEGRVAVVTGAAGKGMGRSIALTLAREGASVVVNYRTSSESAAAIVGHIEKHGGHAIAVEADITQQDQCRALVDSTIKAFERIDICIVGPGGGWHPEPVDKLDAAAALEDANCELAPLYNLMPLVLPDMYKRQWGRLIAISLLLSKPSPSFAYNSAKAARTHALLSACDAAWPHGVTVNVVAPGPVGELATLKQAVDLCDHGTKWKKRKNVTPQDIAESVAWLCSEAGSFISGCELPFLFH